MRIINSILTKSDCYRTGRKINIQGIVLHSIGVGQPDPTVFVRNWNRPGINKGVHAFIGDKGLVYQTLPWNHRAWHIGGAANNTHIGVEMTEPAGIKYTGGSRFVFNSSDLPRIQAHVRAAYRTSVELFAFLCKQYGLNPLKDGVIISHTEGWKRGLGSNHGDPEHLWNQTKVGFTMSGFRKDVQKAMLGGVVTIPSVTPPSTPTTSPKPSVSEATKQLQRDLTELGFPPKGGIDGSAGPGTIAATKAFQKSVGLEQDGSAGPLTQGAINKALKEKRETASSQAEKTSGYIEVIYRGADGVNIRKTPTFSKDGVVDIARTGAIYKVVSKTKDFYRLENGNYISSDEKYVRFDKQRVYNKTTANLNMRRGPSTSNPIILVIPRGASVMTVAVDKGWAKVVYNSLEGWVSGEYLTGQPVKPVSKESLIKINTPILNIRESATTGSRKVGTVKQNEVLTIVETKNGWGRLKSGAGWVYLEYTKKP